MANNRAKFNQFVQAGSLKPTDFPTVKFSSDKWSAFVNKNGHCITSPLFRRKSDAIDNVLGELFAKFKIEEDPSHVIHVSNFTIKYDLATSTSIIHCGSRIDRRLLTAQDHNVIVSRMLSVFDEFRE